MGWVNRLSAGAYPLQEQTAEPQEGNPKNASAIAEKAAEVDSGGYQYAKRFPPGGG